MNVVVLGLNHKTAPIEIRERLAFDAVQIEAALTKLKERYGQSEFVVLSTCNRVELYCASGQDVSVVAKGMAELLSDFHGVDLEEFRECLYVFEDAEAVRHLLMVASSLDSMVIGEAQIIGQVKEGYRRACAAKSTGKILNRLFHCAFFTAKQVHASTAIADGRVSVAGVAVELAKQLFADITGAKVVVIGAGETGQLVVRHLLQVGCRDVVVVNRSYERAAQMAERFGITAGEWDQLSEKIGSAHIVISSASAQEYLYRRETFPRQPGRSQRQSVLIVDLGVPRNFDPAINEIEDVYLYSIDELKEVAEQNLKAREQDIAKGVKIVGEQAAEFMDWLRAKDIGPLIGSMKEQFRRIGQDELQRFFVGPRQEASCKEPMEVMLNRIVNKFVHCVIENVDAVAKEDGAAEAAKLIDSIVQRAAQIAAEHSDQEESES